MRALRNRAKACAEAIEAGAGIVAETARATGKETILLVEDDEQVRSTVKRILANLGYGILEARDGQEAGHSHPIAPPVAMESK